METTDESGIPQGTDIQYPSVLASEITGNELPLITRDQPSHITFVWPGYELIADATRFNDKGEAEVLFWYDHADFRQLLVQKRVNLLSSSNTAALVKQLRDSNDGVRYLPWDWVVTCITYKVLRTARDGAPVIEIWPNEDDDLAPRYLLEPVLYLNHPTVIFGDYGNGKSLFALVIGYVAQLPYADNKLGLVTLDKATPCLYLDYEDDPSSFTRRWSAIQRGFGLPPASRMPIRYKRMTSTLAESVGTLQQEIAEEKIKLLIVDSLGPAARGNLNDSEPAVKYHDALRKLGVTSLTLAHNAKDPLTKKRSIFGSVFFTNLARSVWECKAGVEPGENEAIVSLKQIKANLSKLHPALGYRFTFSNNAITIARADLADTELSGELPIRWQIIHLIDQQGRQPTASIVSQVPAKRATIERILRRMREGNELAYYKEDDSWGRS